MSTAEPMMPFHDPRFPGDGKASHFQLILRRRPDGKSPEIDSDVREELSQIIAYLKALRDGEGDPGPPLKKADGAETSASQPPPPPSPRLTLPADRGSLAKNFKLARVRLGSKIHEEPPISREDILREIGLLTDSELFAEDTTPVEPEAAAPVEAVAAEVPEPVPAAVPARRARWPFALAGAGLLAALGWAAFFSTRPAPSVHAERPAAMSPNKDETISDEAARTAELALRAIQGGRLEEASGVLADARKHGVVLPGLRYQAALLTLRQGDVHASTELIFQSLAAGECIPECLYLRANSAAAGGDYAAVCDLFEQAAGYAAFSPRYYFFWAEALRRYGHSAQALTQFERALLCRPTSTDAELIRFKMGLAQIEAGADEKFDAHLQFLLAQKTVPGDALLLAAAVEINRADYPAAAAYLQRARDAMPPALLLGRLRDFLFQSRAHQHDLAAVWPATAPAAPAAPADPTASAAPVRPRVFVVDPATRGLAEADPAVW